MPQRLLYPDLCKFFAIFLVTWSHCAQCVSGEIWTNFLGGMQLDIAFNMPMFMLISGWFINPDKMRITNIPDFVIQKFKRLIIPSFVWYCVYCMLSLSKPGLSVLTFYWYLNALFICLCVIMLFSKLFKSNIACCLISTTVILLFPYSDYSHVNFMFPFLWAGFWLRKLFATKHITLFIIICVLSGVLSIFWNYKYTVYCSPLKISSFDMQMLYAYAYRFLIGFSISTALIYLIMKIQTNLSRFAHLGTYSLAIYTASLAAIGCLSKIFYHLNIHIKETVIIDVVSLCVSLLLIYVIIIFTNYCRKHKLLKILFLGE